MLARFLLVVALLAVGALPALAQTRYRAVDGDTLALGTERFRLVGFDTPETIQAACPAEREHGRRAKERLQALVTRGPVRLERAKGRDKYGRTLAVLFIGGEPAGDILVREGLAVPYTGRIRRVVNYNWCANL
jgi:endonuclease YncB( thermonuclease family)